MSTTDTKSGTIEGNNYEFCIVEKRGHTWEITINRPQALNALHPPANFELERVFDAFAGDSNARVAIITGAGDRAFSTGNDLKYQAQGNKLEVPKTGLAGLTARFNLDKPVIAAVEGYAMGGGFEIALACDIIIADDTARFALPEPKVGMAALAGGIHRLSRQIGEKFAMELLLTGKQVEASEGRRLGFVNQCVETGGALAAARELAAQMLQCSPVSLQVTKQMAREGLCHASLEAAIKHPYAAFNTMLNSKDFIEGPLAFAEKRAPQWTNE